MNGRDLSSTINLLRLSCEMKSQHSHTVTGHLLECIEHPRKNFYIFIKLNLGRFTGYIFSSFSSRFTNRDSVINTHVAGVCVVFI